MAVGDPACDLIVAWELLDEPSRKTFRAELAVDDATWQRGRSWALSTAVGALAYYEDSNPFMADQARRSSAQCSATTPCGHPPAELPLPPHPRRAARSGPPPNTGHQPSLVPAIPYRRVRDASRHFER
jgi:hypothetical protein